MSRTSSRLTEPVSPSAVSAPTRRLSSPVGRTPSASRRVSSGSRAMPMEDFGDNSAARFIHSRKDEVRDYEWRSLVGEYATEKGIRANEAAQQLSGPYRAEKAELGLSRRRSSSYGRSPSPTRGRGYSANTTYARQHNSWQDAIKDGGAILHMVYPHLKVNQVAHVLSYYEIRGTRMTPGQLNIDALRADVQAAKSGAGPIPGYIDETLSAPYSSRNTPITATQSGGYTSRSMSPSRSPSPYRTSSGRSLSPSAYAPASPRRTSSGYSAPASPRRTSSGYSASAYANPSSGYTTGSYGQTRANYANPSHHGSYYNRYGW